MAKEQEQLTIEQLGQRLSQVEAGLAAVQKVLEQVTHKETSNTALISLDVREYPGLTFDSSSGEFRLGKSIVKLSFLPSKLVGTVIQANGSVVTYDKLISVMYPGQEDELRYDAGIKYLIRQHVFQAKKKMKKVFPELPKYLWAVRCRGMRWAPPGEEK